MPKRFGWFAPLIRKLNERRMKKFSFCWIPDVPGDESLAGDLISFGAIDQSIKVRHIGWLSRFTASPFLEKKYDLLCILSGPEPQRSQLEEIIVRQLSEVSARTLIVRGLPGARSILNMDGKGEAVNFLGAQALQDAINASEVILARSGFSTVMDFARLGGKAVFVPTPGQTEQEYLAQRLQHKKIAFSMPQDGFDLQLALLESRKYSGFTPHQHHRSLLEKAADEILSLQDLRDT